MLLDLMRKVFSIVPMEGAGDGTGAGGGDGGGGDGGAGAGDGGAAGAGAKGAGDGAGAGAGGDSKGDKGAAGGDGKGAGGSLMRSLGKDGAGAGAGGDGKGAAAGDGKGLTDAQKAEKAALEAAESDPKRPKHVPAKYWDAVKGEIRAEQAFKSLGELETRMRSTGLPPKSPDDYKYDVPEKVKALGGDLDPAMNKAFRAQAHAKGLNQEQFAWVLDSYFEHAMTLGNQVLHFSEAACRTELLAHYKTEEEMTKANQRAYRAFVAFADPQDLEKMDSIGNIPMVVRLLDKIGKEIGEDPGVGPDAILDAESIDTLMRGAPGVEDSPYWNASDPRHKATKAKVERHHQAVAASNRRKAA